MPCLRFNEAINVSFVEFGEVLKSSCKFEFLTLLEPAVILKGGEIKAWHTQTFVNPHFHKAYLTPLTYDLESTTGLKTILIFIRQKNVALGQDAKEAHRIWPDPQTLPWTQTHTLGSLLAAWLTVMSFWQSSSPSSLQSVGVSGEPEADRWVLSLRDVRHLSPLKCNLQVCVSTLFSMTFTVLGTQ